MRRLALGCTLIGLALVSAACSDDGEDDPVASTTAPPITAPPTTLTPEDAAAVESLLTLEDLPDGWALSSLRPSSIEPAITEIAESEETCGALLELTALQATASGTAEIGFETPDGDVILVDIRVMEDAEGASAILEQANDADLPGCLEIVLEAQGAFAGDYTVEATEALEIGDDAVQISITGPDGLTSYSAWVQSGPAVTRISTVSAQDLDATPYLETVTERLDAALAE